ncbi:MAG: sulfite exporter TauE/SafE family protein [Bdellovibrionales bacterium]
MPFDNSSFVFIISIFLASIVGSFHCVGMCGGLMLASTDTQSRYLYHLGRGLSYLVIGILAGAFGEAFYFSGVSTGLKAVASFFIVAVLFYSGVQLIFRPEKSSRIGEIFSKVSRKLFPIVFQMNLHARTFFIGLMTGLLPCGWLYSFVILAIVSGSLIKGALVLIFFWVGTIPALVLVDKSQKWLTGSKATGLYRSIGFVFVILSLLILSNKNIHVITLQIL